MHNIWFFFFFFEFEFRLLLDIFLYLHTNTCLYLILIIIIDMMMIVKWWYKIKKKLNKTDILKNILFFFNEFIFFLILHPEILHLAYIYFSLQLSHKNILS